MHIKNRLIALLTALAIGLVLTTVVMSGFALASPPAAPLHQDGTRGTITVTTMSPSGLAQSLSATDGDGQKFTNTGDVFLIMTNDYTATVTATLVTAATFGGFAIDDVDIAITASTTALAGPFATGIFNQKTGTDKGKIYVNWSSAVTGTIVNSVTVGAYKLDN